MLVHAATSEVFKRLQKIRMSSSHTVRVCQRQQIMGQYRGAKQDSKDFCHINQRFRLILRGWKWALFW